MNGRASKLLRRISKASGIPTKALKKVWKTKSHIERHKIAGNLPKLYGEINGPRS